MIDINTTSIHLVTSSTGLPMITSTNDEDNSAVIIATSLCVIILVLVIVIIILLTVILILYSRIHKISGNTGQYFVITVINSIYCSLFRILCSIL